MGLRSASLSFQYSACRTVVVLSNYPKQLVATHTDRHACMHAMVRLIAPVHKKDQLDERAPQSSTVRCRSPT